MKKNGLLWLMASALMLCLTYTSCDELPEEEDINKEEQKQDGDDTTVTSIYGIWVNDLANPSDTLIFKEDGTGMMWNETVKFNYENNILVVGKEKYEVTIEGDVMTWAMIDDEGGKQPTGQVWFNPAGKYDKQLSDGRWDGFMGEDGSSHGMVYRFKGNEFDIYIIAWGEQIKGTFTHKGGVMHLSIREGYNARIGDEDNWSWEAGNLDPVTLQLSEGYNWWKMDQEVLKRRQEEMAKVTFALVSDVKAYGGVFGRTMVIEKSK